MIRPLALALVLAFAPVLASCGKDTGRLFEEWVEGDFILVRFDEAGRGALIEKYEPPDVAPTMIRAHIGILFDGRGP